MPNTPSKKQKKKITIYNELQDGFGLRVVGQVDGAVTGYFIPDHIFCCHLNHGFTKDCMHFGLESEFSNTILSVLMKRDYDPKVWRNSNSLSKGHNPMKNVGSNIDKYDNFLPLQLDVSSGF